MFELSRRKPLIPRRVALWAALLGAFGLGLATGKLLAGAKPYDWSLEIMNLVIGLVWTIVFAVAAAKRDPAANN